MICPICRGRMWDPGHGDCPKCQTQDPSMREAICAKMELQRAISQLTSSFERYTGTQVRTIILDHRIRLGTSETDVFATVEVQL